MRIALILAAVWGAGMAVWLFPADFLWPGAGGPWRPVGDAAQHAVAQRYFIASAWVWPPLNVAMLGGLNLAFADGIPLLALALKALAPLLPAGFHGIGLWYALVWILTPVCAAWAMAGAGERRALPLLAVAVAAASMPAFIMRFGHAALCGHFLLWLGLGFYLRLVAGARVWPGAILLQGVALLVHPYLAVMNLALLAAVPATLMLRRAPWLGAALGAAAGLALVGGIMTVLGYLGAAGDGRRWYGAFALNLLSPMWPFRSWFLGGGVLAEVDATGHGGWEGYNWLGLGLWLGLAAVLLWRPRLVLGGLRRHAGLVLACLGLTVLAVTGRVGLGGAVLFDLGEAPGLFEQFRASGRFFWPVGVALLLAMGVLLSRQGRAGGLALVVLALVQFLDATPARLALHDWARGEHPWRMDAARLRPLLAAAERVTLLPSWPCTGPEEHATREALLEMLALASETPRPINTMYAARWREMPRCTDEATRAMPVGPGELRLEFADGAWRATPGPR